MTKYSDIITNVPQTEAVFGKNQVKNNAGGYVFTISDWDRLNRFLILGSEKNSYYVKGSVLSKENAENVLKLIEQDGCRVVDETVKISDSGRAPKNDPAIFVMALASAFGNADVKAYAFRNLNKVCRTATHLFQFVEDVQKFRGWGRGLRKAIANWYLDKNTSQLVYQVIKYKNREGWTHKDTISLSHPVAVNDDMAYIFNKIVKGYDEVLPVLDDTNSVIDQFNLGMNFEKYLSEMSGDTVKNAVKLIKKYNMPRETVPTQLLNEVDIWEALMSNDGENCTMPITALIRNLAKMTMIGYLAPLSKGTMMVCKALSNKEVIHKSRIHPINILIALKTYSAGKGFRGNNTWTPVPAIESALEDAFYLAFDNVEPTNKRYLVALDVSGSMSWPINDTNLRSCEVTAAMSMILLKTEPNVHVVGFCNKVVDLGISKSDKLNSVCKKVVRNNWGGTDVASAINWALNNKIEVDVFNVWTDNDTWCGRTHPFQALQKYRKKMGIDAKVIVCATEATAFSVADPADKGMLDIAGFDASVPNIIAEFSRGNI